MAEAKPYAIPKQIVWEAYKKVKANRGAAGVDGQSLADFEKDLKGNLYKLWNRMSSGSYFPPPVRLVEIPKGNTGKTRPLGIPTVSDRIAQMVVKLMLEPHVEPHFHKDSYGYRPGKSALDAVGVTRQRCWRRNWVIDLDIKGFFDNLDWDLVMRAVRHHTSVPWILLYVERWLRAPVQHADGRLEERTKGSPQGSVISPLLSNLFMHYAFDFLGYTFRPRRAKNRWGKLFISFLPGVSNKAANSIRETIRSWRIGATRNNQSLEEIASFVNPFVRGWVNYYGRYYPSALTPVLRSLERSLVYWVRRKLKRFRYHQRQAVHWLGQVAQREPRMFVLWSHGIRPATGQ